MVRRSQQMMKTMAVLKAEVSKVNWIPLSKDELCFGKDQSLYYCLIEHHQWVGSKSQR
jgi:hypothetical protein